MGSGGPGRSDGGVAGGGGCVGALGGEPGRGPGGGRGTLDQDRQNIERTGERNSLAGYDLTSSAPKSVSVMWRPPPTRVHNSISAAHHGKPGGRGGPGAEASFVRRGRNGVRQEQVSGCWRRHSIIAPVAAATRGCEPTWPCWPWRKPVTGRVWRWTGRASSWAVRGAVGHLRLPPGQGADTYTYDTLPSDPRRELSAAGEQALGRDRSPDGPASPDRPADSDGQRVRLSKRAPLTGRPAAKPTGDTSPQLSHRPDRRTPRQPHCGQPLDRPLATPRPCHPPTQRSGPRLPPHRRRWAARPRSHPGRSVSPRRPRQHRHHRHLHQSSTRRSWPPSTVADGTNN